MPGTVKPVPEGHRTVAPYLAIKDAARALDRRVRDLFVAQA